MRPVTGRKSRFSLGKFTVRCGRRAARQGRSFGPAWGNALRSLAMRFPPVHFARFLPWLGLVAVAALAACGGSHDDTAKRLSEMQAELTKLENHGDRLEERLEALEIRKDEAAAAARLAAATPTPTVERPRLMVVKLEPGDDAHDAPTDAPTAALRPEDSAADQTPRPVIRIYGSHTDSDAGGSDSPRHKR